MESQQTPLFQVVFSQPLYNTQMTRVKKALENSPDAKFVRTDQFLINVSESDLERVNNVPLEPGISILRTEKMPEA